MKKIYSKFVKDRRKIFQIETALWDNGGKKAVSKRNIYEEGKNHIDGILETYNMYSASELLCKVSRMDDKVIFEYITGNTFETLLLMALEQNNSQKVKELIGIYNDILEQICTDERAVQIVEDQIAEGVFGKMSYGKCGYVNAIFDLTFDNIIYDGSKYNIIDYEWRFPFAVEKEFIKFRAIYAFVMKFGGYITQLFTINEFYKMFNVSLEDNDRFLSYNDNFIKYVYGIDGYNDVLKKYEKSSIELFNDANINMLKQIQKSKETGEDTFENKLFNNVNEEIESHKDLYDDYTKFFKVTKKLKETHPHGYIESKEFCEEFSNYIKDLYNMLEYYKNDLVGYYKNENDKFIGEMKKLGDEIQNLNNQISNYNNQIGQLRYEVEKRDNDITYYQNALEQKDEQIAMGHNREQELTIALESTIDRKIKRRVAKIKKVLPGKKG